MTAGFSATEQAAGMSRLDAAPIITATQAAEQHSTILRRADMDKLVPVSLVADLLDRLADDLASADLLVGDYWDPNTRKYEAASPAVVQRQARENLAGIRAEFDSQVVML